VREVSNRETRRTIGARDRLVEERRTRRGNLLAGSVKGRTTIKGKGEQQLR
jgi:hypothetical protein